MRRLVFSLSSRRRFFWTALPRRFWRSSRRRRVSSSPMKLEASSRARIVKKIKVARAYIFGVTVFFVME